mgnify:CR=1 FL=1
MSRDLPARPNLDHLKKQAKELFQALKEQDPTHNSPTHSTRSRENTGSAAGRGSRRTSRVTRPRRIHSLASGPPTCRGRSSIRSIAFKPQPLDSTSKATTSRSTSSWWTSQAEPIVV